MKIVCDNCGAKYSIADEKVKGKVFKIRCKKCNQSIVVRGTSEAPSAAHQPAPAQKTVPARAPAEEEGEAETKVFDYAGYRQGDDAAIWHIVVEDQRQGPYTKAQVTGLVRKGSLNADSLVWREGFDDWLPLAEIADFATSTKKTKAAAGAAPAARGGGLFDAQPAPTPKGGGLFDEQPGGGVFGAGAAGRKAASSGSPFDTGGGLFGESAQRPAGATAGDVFSSTAGNEAAAGGALFDKSDGRKKSGDLFGSTAKAQEADAGNEGIFSSTKGPAAVAEPVKSPRVTAEQAMLKGQRNENSVLFSLSNLQALAAAPVQTRTQPQQTAAVSGGGEMMGGMAGGKDEASGLIDIRSLTGSLSTAEQDNSVDDLISMSGPGFAPGFTPRFAPALGAPILATQSEGMSSGAKVGIAVSIVAVLVVVVVVLVVLFTGEDEEKAAARAQIAALEDQLRGQLDRSKDSQNSAAIEELRRKLEDAKGTNPTAPSQMASNEDDKSKSSSKNKKRTGRSRTDKSGSEEGDEAEPSGEASSPGASAPAKKTNSELDDLLGGAAPSSSKSDSPSPKGGGGGGTLAPAAKASLSRDDVQQGMASVAPAVQRCGQGKGGTITVSVQIGTTGRVTSAAATGAFAGTPIGSCAARAIRRAKFPATQQNLTVKYPFKL